MSDIPVKKERAIKAYNNTDADGRRLLSDLLGAEHFNQKITERIKSYEDACDGCPKPLPYPCINRRSEDDADADRQEAVNAFFMLDIIAEKLRDGAVLDWANGDQPKWCPYFNQYSSGAGFRFDGSVVGWTNALTYGGARLCVDTKEKADHFGTCFLHIWNKFLKPHK